MALAAPFCVSLWWRWQGGGFFCIIAPKWRRYRHNGEVKQSFECMVFKCRGGSLDGLQGKPRDDSVERGRGMTVCGGVVCFALVLWIGGSGTGIMFGELWVEE